MMLKRKILNITNELSPLDKPEHLLTLPLSYSNQNDSIIK